MSSHQMTTTPGAAAADVERLLRRLVNAPDWMVQVARTPGVGAVLVHVSIAPGGEMVEGTDPPVETALRAELADVRAAKHELEQRIAALDAELGAQLQVAEDALTQEQRDHEATRAQRDALLNIGDGS